MKMRIIADTLIDSVSSACVTGSAHVTHSRRMLNRMSRFAWKMLAMPSAKPSRMHSTPVLQFPGQPPQAP